MPSTRTAKARFNLPADDLRLPTPATRMSVLLLQKLMVRPAPHRSQTHGLRFRFLTQAGLRCMMPRREVSLLPSPGLQPQTHASALTDKVSLSV